MKKLMLCMAMISSFAMASTNDAPNNQVDFGSSGGFTPLATNDVDNALAAVPKPSKGGGNYGNGSNDAGVEPQKVFPDKLVHINISHQDNNHIVCKNGYIQTRVLSQEKPLTFTINSDKRSAFIKLKARVNTKTNQTFYYTKPVDLYVVCDNQTYAMMLQPTANLLPQTIILDGGRGDEVASAYKANKAIPFEDNVIGVFDKIRTERKNNSLPAVFHVKKAELTEEWQTVTDNVSARLVETIKLEGSGFTVHIYHLYATAEEKLHEMDIVRAGLKRNLGAVRLYKHHLYEKDVGVAYVATRD